MEEIDESVFSNEGATVDNGTSTTVYQKMKSLCLVVKNEIRTDIEMNTQNILPRYHNFAS